MTATVSGDAFSDLGDLDRWVAWRTEKRGSEGKPTKVPYGTGDRRAKADEPGTWITRPQAEAAARRLVNGAGGGIGIELGDLGHDVFMAGLDLDSCCIEDGRLADWAAEILAAVPSYGETSPSGTGIKAFFYMVAEDIRPFLDRIGVESTGWGMRRSVGESGRDHGPAVEFYAARRYFAVTGDLWPGQPDRIALLGWPALERLAALIPPPRGAKPGEAGEAKGDDSRSAIAFRKGAALRRDGKTFDEMCQVLRSDPETADWYLQKGLTSGMRELKRIWEKAERGQAGDADAAEIARLARLSALAYEREREAAAERLGCRTSILDRLVRKERRPDDDAAPGQGRTLDLPSPEPWPHPVDGAALIEEMAAAIRRHVVLPDRDARGIALWAVGAHAFDAWAIYPRLFVTAPERGCGKTTLLDVLSRLVPKALPASNISAAALFRTIEAARPTLLLDEADAYVTPDHEDLRSVVDAGHSRGGAVIRTVGDDHEPRKFSAWAPMALAAIGRLPATIEDRSIAIRLKRRRPDEEIVGLRLDRPNGLDTLARKAARWATDNLAALREADPEMPEGVINRPADNWRPLLAVADLAGAGDVARRDAVELLFDPDGERSARVLLLGDLRDLFDEEPSGVLFTSEIITGLITRDDRPWPEWKVGKPITSRQLATLLKPFGMTTNQNVRRGENQAKGYRRDQFEDAFARYLEHSQK